MSLKGRPALAFPTFPTSQHYSNHTHIQTNYIKYIETSRGLCCESAMKYFQLHFRISRLQDRGCNKSPEHKVCSAIHENNLAVSATLVYTRGLLFVRKRFVDPCKSCRLLADWELPAQWQPRPEGWNFLRQALLQWLRGWELCRENIFEFRSTTSRTIKRRISNVA